MATKAIDLVTVCYALNELSSTFFDNCLWQATDVQQLQLLAWCDEHRETINGLDNLTAHASTDYVDLNAFLTKRGFDPLFLPFEGVGVASVLDMLVKWLSKGTLTTVMRNDRSAGRGSSLTTYPAFTIDASGADVFNMPGFANPLVRLRTVSGHNLWLMKTREPVSEIELVFTAEELLGAQMTLNQRYSGATVPMLEIDVRPDLSWIHGMHAVTPKFGYQEIVQAFQQFKLRATQEGARVKVATGFATRGGPVGPVPYVFDEPFIGFFTPPGNDELPMAVFWADTDAWKNSGETLEML